MPEKKQKILMIDACVREQSRTRRLAEYLLSKLDGDVERIELEKVRFPHMDQQFLNMRDQAAAGLDDEQIIHRTGAGTFFRIRQRCRGGDDPIWSERNSGQTPSQGEFPIFSHGNC